MLISPELESSVSETVAPVSVRGWDCDGRSTNKYSRLHSSKSNSLGFGGKKDKQQKGF